MQWPQGRILKLINLTQRGLGNVEWLFLEEPYVIAVRHPTSVYLTKKTEVDKEWIRLCLKRGRWVTFKDYTKLL